MARHGATLLEEPITAPIPRMGANLDPRTNVPTTSVTRPPRRWRRAGVFVAVVALSVLSGLTGGFVAATLVPQSDTVAPSAPASFPIVSAPTPVPMPAISPAAPISSADSNETRSSTSSDATAEESGTDDSERDTDGAETESVGNDSDDASASEGGDGCGPYEHKLDGGWCSPDTDVLDEDGNPDPARAVVPGNLS